MENISVAIRFRPPIPSSSSSDLPWTVDSNRITLLAFPVPNLSFTFDHVFDRTSTNATIYGLLVRSLIRSALDGFNGTAFAYGQTSSGKTFTMYGSEDDPGIVPLAVQDVFRTARMSADREFLIRVSYMEIYNEEINDLLTLGSQKLPIHESLERGVFVAGLREEIVSSAEQVLELLKLGEANRHFGETNMNARSSRSHTIFRMVIESSAKDVNSFGDVTSADAIRVSVLNLVDLAGSERIAKTGAGGVRLKEGKYINKSLMVLGNVINKLSDNGKQRGHIPYRDSKLTRILQPALGGNAKTSIICTVAPEEVHIEETRGTLHFASRAKRVTNCAQINEVLTDAALLKRQKLEIEELRRKLQGSHSGVLEQVVLKQRNDMHKSELERERLIVELEEERKARESLAHCIREQQKRIDDLTIRTTSDHAARSIQQKLGAGGTYDEVNMLHPDEFRTPDLKQMSNVFVARRSNCSKDLDSSPIPENFANIADEDLWMRLNKGCTTDLDMLQTPRIKRRSFSSREISLDQPFQEEAIDRKCERLEIQCSLERQQLETSEEQRMILECECNQLREEKASLLQTLSISKQDIDILRAEKEELVKELNLEKQMMKGLKEEIQLFSLAFSQREGLLTSLYTKSKAIVENLKSFQVTTPELYD
ncbi:kinesin-like protein KIN-7L isoform X1 [Ananas comosus]|uniref:Kinesin-like protein n=1 Tax=Ananas comosus TaxID=4615 RepID=A0A6P5FTB4_ANACO|nr:kinesin-like protein KIN-7L isoform X1 [Ananas comosus]